MIDKNYLDSCFHYDSSTGILKWKSRPLDHFATVRGWRTFNSQKAGKVAGTENLNGYLQVCINKKVFLVHRLAFILNEHNLDGYHVDHLNHDRKDNRWANLRLVLQSENNKNLTMRKTNSIGITGVYFNPEEKLWYPRIQVDYSNIYLGATKDFFEACCRRKSAELKYNFHKNHGLKEV